MRILVTGGTGYVGSRTVAALRGQGHEVRLLIRDPRRVTAALTPLGVPAADLGTVVGDVTDPAAVERAVRDCEAVVHAGSVYSLDSRDARRIREVNVRGTALVLGAAHRAGLDPIVYVSSVVALLQPNGQSLTPDSPVGRPPGPYLGSKADAERVARRYQEAGAPVVITYPGAVYGPHDPHLGDGAPAAAQHSQGPLPDRPLGRLFDRGCARCRQGPCRGPGARPRAPPLPGQRHLRTPRRPGRGVRDDDRPPTADHHHAGPDAAARRPRGPTGPARHAGPHPGGVRGHLLLPLRQPVRRHHDTSGAGCCPRDLLVTLADSVSWLVQQGQIIAREAGMLATTLDDELQPVGVGELPAGRQWWTGR